MNLSEISADDSIDSAVTYRRIQAVPVSVLDALVYVLGFQQWLCPNADCEYASDARKICQGIYAAVLISNGQYDKSNPHSSEPNWDQVRSMRADIFTDHFYCPDLFDDHIEEETPDDMFDAVEAELTAHGLLHDIPPEREQSYIDRESE